MRGEDLSIILYYCVFLYKLFKFLSQLHCSKFGVRVTSQSIFLEFLFIWGHNCEDTFTIEGKLGGWVKGRGVAKTHFKICLCSADKKTESLVSSLLQWSEETLF